jgi:hypothetical protein
VPADQSDATLANLRVEIVTKPDGRYLIYYSWPDEANDTDGRAAADGAGQPEQEPWNPEAGPADV